MLARDQLWQVLHLLLVGAVQLDLVDAKVGMRPIGERHRGAGPGDLFHCNHMRQIGHARPAVFFRRGDAQKAQLAKLFPQLVGKLVLLVDLGRHRFDALLRPAMHHIAHRVDVFTKIEIHRVHEHGARVSKGKLFERLFIKEAGKVSRVKLIEQGVNYRLRSA